MFTPVFNKPRHVFPSYFIIFVFPAAVSKPPVSLTAWLFVCKVLFRIIAEAAAEVDGTNPVKDIIDIGEVTREETRSAVGDMKNGKTPGIDSITANPLKADTDTTVNKWKCHWGLVQRAYRQTAQEWGFDKL